MGSGSGGGKIDDTVATLVETEGERAGGGEEESNTTGGSGGTGGIACRDELSA